MPGSPVTVNYQAQPADVNTDTTDFSSVCGGLARAVSYNSTLGDFGITAGIGLSAVVIMLRGQAYATPVAVTPGTDGDDVFTVVPGGSFTWEPVTDVAYQLGEDDFIVQASGAGSASGPNPGGAALRQGAGPITGGFSSDPVAVERSSPADAMNYVQLECLDRANSYNTAVVETFDQGSVDLYGVRKDTSLKAHAIVDQIGVGPIVAQLVLQRGLAYRNTYSFSLGWKYCLLEPMDLVQISDARLGIAGPDGADRLGHRGRGGHARLYRGGFLRRARSGALPAGAGRRRRSSRCRPRCRPRRRGCRASARVPRRRSSTAARAGVRARTHRTTPPRRPRSTSRSSSRRRRNCSPRRASPGRN